MANVGNIVVLPINVCANIYFKEKNLDIFRANARKCVQFY